MNWLFAALLSLASFGLWGFLSKMTVLYIDSKSALIFQTVGVMIIGLLTLSLMNFKPAADLRGGSYAVLTGLAYGVGCLFFFIAASKGKIITVVTLTALYPLITIILAYILLEETVSIKQCCGIALALFSIILMST